MATTRKPKKPKYALDKTLRASPIDIRDRIASLPAAASLPPSMDLKADADVVENQFMFNSCTANAGCSALELMYKKVGVSTDLSRMFLYYYVRQLGNNIGDSGAYPRNIGAALKKFGTSLESDWGYTSENLEKEPTAEVIKLAEYYRIVSYESITWLGGDRLDQIKNHIAQGIPVLSTISVQNGLYAVKGDWKTHTWDWNAAVVGSHEVLIIGYDDVSQRLLVENSWGQDWGDGGFFGIPYEMTKTNAFGELWVVHPTYYNDQGTPLVIEPKISTKVSTSSLVKIAAAGIVLFAISQIITYFN